jgi:hypothetical protein
MARLEKNATDRLPKVLITVFPGESHELPALLFAARLATFSIPLRFAGELPEAELRREISANPHYARVYISATMERPLSEFQNFQKRLQTALPGQKIILGGHGLAVARKKA